MRLQFHEAKGMDNATWGYIMDSGGVPVHESVLFVGEQCCRTSNCVV